MLEMTEEDLGPHFFDRRLEPTPPERCTDGLSQGARGRTAWLNRRGSRRRMPELPLCL